MFFVCADVGPRGHEVELVRASAHQGPVRPPRGEPQERERQGCDDVGVRPTKDERAAKRRRFDDPGARPSHGPPIETGGEIEDISHHLEVVR